MTRSLLLALTFFALVLASAPTPSLAQPPDDDATELAPPDHASWVEHDQSANDHGAWTTAPTRAARPTRGAHVSHGHPRRPR